MLQQAVLGLIDNLLYSSSDADNLMGVEEVLVLLGFRGIEASQVSRGEAKPGPSSGA